MSESRSMGTIHGSMRPMEGNSLSMMGDSGKLKGPSASALSVRNMSTISGGVTFSQFAEAREETVNPGAELNVLKAVLLREGYLRRLVELGKEATHTLSPGLGDLLDIIRISSVEVVEAIAEWRKGLAKPVPFMWNGINYLVKMPSDLDFLNHVKPLTSWLGFPMERNPFVIPLPMEQRPGTGAGKKHKVRSGQGQSGKMSRRTITNTHNPNPSLIHRERTTLSSLVTPPPRALTRIQDSHPLAVSSHLTRSLPTLPPRPPRRQRRITLRPRLTPPL